jgi:heterodisulfide reductase subunit A-like polyferredoxin
MRTRPRQVFAQIGSTSPPVHPVQLVDTGVVLGGSVAGLLAARVLADHAGSVPIIERDAPTDVVGVRRFRAVTVMLEHPATLFAPGSWPVP